MFYADTVGLDVIYDKILEFQKTLDPQYWQPAPLLEKLAREGQTFAAWQRAGRTLPLNPKEHEHGKRIHPLRHLLVDALCQVAGLDRPPEQHPPRRQLRAAHARRAQAQFPGSDRPGHPRHHQSAAGQLLRPALADRHARPGRRPGPDRAAGLRHQRPSAADGGAGSDARQRQLRPRRHRRPLLERSDRVLPGPDGARRQRASPRSWMLDNFGHDPYAKNRDDRHRRERRAPLRRRHRRAERRRAGRYAQYQDALADDRAFQKRYMDGGADHRCGFPQADRHAQRRRRHVRDHRRGAGQVEAGQARRHGDLRHADASRRRQRRRDRHHARARARDGHRQGHRDRAARFRSGARRERPHADGPGAGCAWRR